MLLLASRSAKREHPLHLALERMGAVKGGVLSLVNKIIVHDMMGVVALANLLDAFGIKSRLQIKLM
jgi:hypothetical protein